MHLWDEQVHQAMVLGELGQVSAPGPVTTSLTCCFLPCRKAGLEGYWKGYWAKAKGYWDKLVPFMLTQIPNKLSEFHTL